MNDRRKKTLENGRQRVISESEKLLNDLSKEQLIKLVSLMCGEDYTNTKHEKWNFSVDDQINILKEFIEVVESIN